MSHKKAIHLYCLISPKWVQFNDPCPKVPGNPTWRIIPVSKELATLIYEPFIPIGRGPTTLLRGLTITMVINHLLNGMILQVPPKMNECHLKRDHLKRTIYFPTINFSGGYVSSKGGYLASPKGAQSERGPLKQFVAL